MKNIKKLLGIFNCYTCGQILEQINEAKMYMHGGAENLPIDISDSLRFLNDLDGIFRGMVHSPKKHELVQDGDNQGVVQLLDCGPGIFLHGGNEGPKLLRAEMRRILTDDNLEQYLRVMEFVEALIEVFKE